LHRKHPARRLLAGTLTGRAVVVITNSLDIANLLNGKASGTYYYRVKTTAAGMADSGWVTAGANSITVTAAVAPPDYIYVPSVSTGSYEVAWPASSTAGATYVLEEGTDEAFTAPTNLYNVAVNRKSFSGKASGTYYYRVKGVLAGYTDSPFVTAGANSVVVTAAVVAPDYIYVPSSSLGSYEVSWAVSATPGATYVLEEGTDAAFTAPTNLYNVPTNRLMFNGKASGTYYYRVKGVLAGYSDSPFVTAGANSVTVTAAVEAPAYIYVPSTNIGGIYEVTWATSATPGVTYVLEEDTNILFTAPTVVYTGTAP